MQINWTVRLNNPTWWAHILIALFVPVLTHAGVNFADIESWGSLFQIFGGALGNPAVVVAMVVSVWNLLIDPTTKGLSDSDRALTYIKPN